MSARRTKSAPVTLVDSEGKRHEATINQDFMFLSVDLKPREWMEVDQPYVILNDEELIRNSENEYFSESLNMTFTLE